MYITVMDYNTNAVITYVIGHKINDAEQWIAENTDHQLDEIDWMINDCMPEHKFIDAD